MYNLKLTNFKTSDSFSFDLKLSGKGFEFHSKTFMFGSRDTFIQVTCFNPNDMPVIVVIFYNYKN